MNRRLVGQSGVSKVFGQNFDIFGFFLVAASSAVAVTVIDVDAK